MKLVVKLGGGRFGGGTPGDKEGGSAGGRECLARAGAKVSSGFGGGRRRGWWAVGREREFVGLFLHRPLFSHL